MDADAQPPVLLPCTICARTFKPQSLEKHARICERAVARKRKPFDSAKQRIQGTELAEFLPKQEPRRQHQQDERGCSARSSWKKKHDDLLRVIREARGDAVSLLSLFPLYVIFFLVFRIRAINRMETIRLVARFNLQYYLRPISMLPRLEAK